MKREEKKIHHVKAKGKSEAEKKVIKKQVIQTSVVSKVISRGTSVSLGYQSGRLNLEVIVKFITVPFILAVISY